MTISAIYSVIYKERVIVHKNVSKSYLHLFVNYNFCKNIKPFKHDIDIVIKLLILYIKRFLAYFKIKQYRNINIKKTKRKFLLSDYVVDVTINMTLWVVQLNF